MINGDLMENIEIKEKLIEENEQLRTDNDKLKNKTKNIEKYIEILENQINRNLKIKSLVFLIKQHRMRVQRDRHPFQVKIVFLLWFVLDQRVNPLT